MALSRIADALEVTTDDLLGRTETEPLERQIDRVMTPEARIVSFGMDQLSQKDRDTIISVLQAMYRDKPYLFKRGANDDT